MKLNLDKKKMKKMNNKDKSSKNSDLLNAVGIKLLINYLINYSHQILPKKLKIHILLEIK